MRLTTCAICGEDLERGSNEICASCEDEYQIRAWDVEGPEPEPTEYPPHEQPGRYVPPRTPEEWTAPKGIICACCGQYVVVRSLVGRQRNVCGSCTAEILGSRLGETMPVPGFISPSALRTLSEGGWTPSPEDIPPARRYPPVPLSRPLGRYLRDVTRRAEAVGGNRYTPGLGVVWRSYVDTHHQVDPRVWSLPAEQVEAGVLENVKRDWLSWTLANAHTLCGRRVEAPPVDPQNRIYLSLRCLQYSCALYRKLRGREVTNHAEAWSQTCGHCKSPLIPITPGASAVPRWARRIIQQDDRRRAAARQMRMLLPGGRHPWASVGGETN